MTVANLSCSCSATLATGRLLRSASTWSRAASDGCYWTPPISRNG
jgi:hypothetical protein